MQLRTVLVTGVLAATWMNGGCGGGTRPTPPTAPSPPPVAASCDAGKAQFSIGQRASDDLLERARVAAGASIARFLLPNQPITLEYFAWRLNLGLDDQNVVKSVNCG